MNILLHWLSNTNPNALMFGSLLIVSLALVIIAGAWPAIKDTWIGTTIQITIYLTCFFVIPWIFLLWMFMFNPVIVILAVMLQLAIAGFSASIARRVQDDQNR